MGLNTGLVFPNKSPGIEKLIAEAALRVIPVLIKLRREIGSEWDCLSFFMVIVLLILLGENKKDYKLGLAQEACLFIVFSISKENILNHVIYGSPSILIFFKK